MGDVLSEAGGGLSFLLGGNVAAIRLYSAPFTYGGEFSVNAKSNILRSVWASPALFAPLLLLLLLLPA